MAGYNPCVKVILHHIFPEEIMEIGIEDLTNKVLEQLKTIAKTDTIIGQHFNIGEFTCVPVIKINLGFGSGGGGGEAPKQGKGTGGGIGGGITITPVAFLVSRGDSIQLLNIGKNKGIDSIMEKIPDIIDSIGKRKDSEEGE
jgi:uncharacterized spore protein YtfJ